MYLTKVEVHRDAKAQACNCKCDSLWVQFPVDKMKCLTFLFPLTGNEVKSGVEFCHSSHYAFRIRRKVGPSH